MKNLNTQHTRLAELNEEQLTKTTGGSAIPVVVAVAKAIIILTTTISTKK